MPTYVAPSPIAGVGLFAGTDLVVGQTIWEYTEGVDWRITPDELSQFPQAFRARLEHYVYLDESGIYVLCGDNAKYMNHADEPNCDDTGVTFTVVCRPVGAGEELTCDYRLFDADARRNGVDFGVTALVG